MEIKEIIPILVDHSILCVLVSLLAWAIKRQNAEAKCERESMQKRLYELIEQTNKFDAHTGHELKEMRAVIQRLKEKLEGNQ